MDFNDTNKEFQAQDSRQAFDTTIGMIGSSLCIIGIVAAATFGAVPATVLGAAGIAVNGYAITRRASNNAKFAELKGRQASIAVNNPGNADPEGSSIDSTINVNEELYRKIKGQWEQRLESEQERQRNLIRAISRTT